MKAILKKEIRAFFGSLNGYLILACFTIINSAFLWGFKSDVNIFDNGYADLTYFFNTATWIFIIVIPALTMKSFSDEFQYGTFDILQTKPITNFSLVLGKSVASVCIIIAMLTPTLVYVYSIYQLTTPIGNIDLGSIIGSYIGLLFISSSFVSIGTWASTLSKNTVISLLSGICTSYLMYDGAAYLATIFPKIHLEYFSLSTHFTSIARGVIDTRDLVFFTAITMLFTTASCYNITSRKTYKKTFVTLAGICLLLYVNTHVFSRFDLTQDKRYSLSQSTEQILNSLDENALIQVYLEGDFPPEFQRLQQETKQLITELKTRSSYVKVNYINPKENIKKLAKTGLTPSKLTVKENGAITEKIIIPWAVITYKGKKEKINLLKDTDPRKSQQEHLQKSVQNLEYAFVSALKKVSFVKDKKIAILTGNKELEDLYLYSFLSELGKSYHLAKFTLDSVAKAPQNTLKQLLEFDLAIIVKPRTAFTEKEKYTLDQYLLNGGKTLWTVDNVVAEMDSLMTTGKTLAYKHELNLDDFFFRYGARINPNLIKDLYAAKIALATGNTGNRPNYENFLWYFNPLVTSKTNHPIIKNIAPVKLEFSSSIDTLKNDINKNILLESSILSKTIQVPAIVNLSTVAEKAKPKNYNSGKKIIGVLLEGEFTSAYKDRIKPFKTTSAREKGVPSKMILISDGNIAKNQLHKGKPLELGINKWTQEFYGNKEFLLNAVDYLLDDKGLINLRSKTIELKLLDKKKLMLEKSFWQFLNFALPLLIIIIFGLSYRFLRKQKYTRF